MKCRWCGSDKVIRWGTRKDKQVWRCKSCGRYFTFGEKRKREERLVIFNYSLGYVIGVLVGDGSISRWKDYHYFDEKGQQVPRSKATKIVPRFRYGFQLQVKDKDFAEEFAKHLSKISGRKATPYEISRPPITEMAGHQLREPYEFHGYKVQMTHKELYKKMKPLAENLSCIKQSNTEVKKGFLRGLFDSEGTVGIDVGAHTRRARISLTNKDEGLILLAKNLLKDLGINSYIQRLPKILKLHIHAKKDVVKFYRIVGFSIKRKSEKIGEILKAKNYSAVF